MAEVFCSESIESQFWTQTRTGWSARRVFFVNNNAESAALLPKVGSRWVVPTTSGMVEIVCVKHDYEPMPVKPQRSQPAKVKATLEYQSVVNISDPVITFETDLEVLESGRGRTFVSDGATRIEYTTTTYPLIGLSVEIQRRTTDLHQIMELEGKINRDSVLVLGQYTWGARKLLFAGFNTRIGYDDTGTLQYHCYYKFQYRPNVPSWNHVWRVEPGELQGNWDELDPPLYVAADFSPLADILRGTT